MSTEQNKAVVRRFMTEVLEGHNLAVLDEVVATNYVNTAMGGADLAGFKAILGAMAAAVSGMRFTIEDLVADGDVVVARFTSEVTRAEWGEGHRPRSHLLPSRQRQDRRRRPVHEA